MVITTMASTLLICPETIAIEKTTELQIKAVSPSSAILQAAKKTPRPSFEDVDRAYVGSSRPSQTTQERACVTRKTGLQPLTDLVEGVVT